MLFYFLSKKKVRNKVIFFEMSRVYTADDVVEGE